MLYDSEKCAVAKCSGDKQAEWAAFLLNTAHFGKRSLLWKEWRAFSLLSLFLLASATTATTTKGRFLLAIRTR